MNVFSRVMPTSKNKSSIVKSMDEALYNYESDFGEAHDLLRECLDHPDCKDSERSYLVGAICDKLSFEQIKKDRADVQEIEGREEETPLQTNSEKKKNLIKNEEIEKSYQRNMRIYAGYPPCAEKAGEQAKSHRVKEGALHDLSKLLFLDFFTEDEGRKKQVLDHMQNIAISSETDAGYEKLVESGRKSIEEQRNALQEQKDRGSKVTNSLD